MFPPCDYGWETSPCGPQSLPSLRDPKDPVAADEPEHRVSGGGCEGAAGTDPKGYDPELPVLQCGGANVLIKHSAHVVEALACDGHPCGRQLLLAQTVGHNQCCGAMFRRLGAREAQQELPASVPLPGTLDVS